MNRKQITYILALTALLGIAISACKGKEREPQTAEKTEIKKEDAKSEPKPTPEKPNLEEPKPSPETPKPSPTPEKPNPEEPKPSPETPQPSPTPEKPQTEEPKPSPETPQPSPTPEKPQTEESKPQPNDREENILSFEPARIVTCSFTGQRCVFCYPMIFAIEVNKKKYPENNLILRIHSNLSGDFYKSEVYENYVTKWSPRRATPNEWLDGSRDFLSMREEDYFKKRIEEGSPVAIRLNRSYQGGKLSVTANTQWTQLGKKNLANTKLRMLLLVVEDKLIGYQVDSRETHPNFEHNRVVRGSINEVWGQPLEVGKPVVVKDFSLARLGAKQTIKPENTHLVALVLDEASKKIYQAEEISLQ